MINGTMHDVFRGMLLLCTLFVCTSGYAQSKKYPYVQDGKIIVCREGNDGVKSLLIHPNWTVTPAHDEKSGEYNRFAARFEVASKDAVVTGVVWDDAVSVCAGYSQDSGGKDKGSWRLPTIRELRLIYALRNELILDFLARYWSATEINNVSVSAWHVDFSTGRSGATKNLDCYVRCVRDL